MFLLQLLSNLKSSVCQYTMIVTAPLSCDRIYHVLYFDMLRLHFSLRETLTRWWRHVVTLKPLHRTAMACIAMECKQTGSGCNVTADTPICLKTDMYNENHYVNIRTIFVRWGRMAQQRHLLETASNPSGSNFIGITSIFHSRLKTSAEAWDMISEHSLAAPSGCGGTFWHPSHWVPSKRLFMVKMEGDAAPRSQG